MIRVENISVKIGKKMLLDNVTASFEPGKMNLIIGPNGAGKSTFVNVLSGQLTPATGTVLYDDVDITKLPAAQLAKNRAVLSQNIQLTFPLNVWEVVMMGGYPHFISKPGDQDDEAVEGSMQLFDIWEMKDRNYMTLSGGEKQRVHFARVLCQLWFPLVGQTRYLMLDEPLTFLDVHYQFEFMRKLETLLADKNLVVVGVVHDLNLAARFADKIVLLNQGQVLACGSGREVLTKDNVLKAFHLQPIIYENRNGSFNLFFE